MAILTGDDSPQQTPPPVASAPDAPPMPTPEQFAAAETAAAAARAEDAARDLAKVEKQLGRQHMALYGFIGVFVIVLGSAMAYLASRQQGPVPMGPPAKPGPVPVISAATDPKPAPVAAAPVVPTPTPTPAPVAPTVAKVEEAPKPVPTAAPAVVAKATPPVPAPVSPAPAPATGPAPLADVLPNKTYLQVGSLDKNVAELLTQGLRIKGVPATVAPGVNATVSRIIVGPFQTNSEMDVVRKQLAELGFTPFPRTFTAADLKPQPAQNAAAVAPAPAKP